MATASDPGANTNADVTAFASPPTRSASTVLSNRPISPVTLSVRTLIFAVPLGMSARNAEPNDGG